jgi:hypothetical protein
MIQNGSLVQGVNMQGKEIKGTVNSIVGFGMVAIVKTGEDRLHFTEAYITDLIGQEK